MRRWLYDEAMYRFDTPEASYWEAEHDAPALQDAALAGNEQCDVAIVGGGYTGLSAAYHLCRDHQLDVHVLEAGHIGWGASGRNGGFCSVGGNGLGGETMIRRYGLDNARDYYRAQVDAVALVRDLIAAEQIDTPLQGDSEVMIACSAGGFDSLKAHAELQYRLLGLDTRVASAEEVREKYFDSPLQHGAAVQKPTFGLHPLRYVRGIAAAATRRGAILHARSEVTSWTKEGRLHVLQTRGGSVRARHVILAGNAFLPEHLDARIAGRTLPMISSIVVTRPLSGDELALQSWHTESPSITALNVLNYFRLLPDRRLLFGGRGSANGSERSAAHNYARLTARLHELFPAWRDVSIDYRWHGLVCMTRRLTPAIGRLADDASVFFALGFHGNGVNTATWSGRQIADWLGSSAGASARVPESIPQVMRGIPERFPFARLRLRYVQAAIALLRLADRAR